MTASLKPVPMNWRTPDYGGVMVARIENLKRLRDAPHLFDDLKQWYKANPAEFIDDWGVTFDPRNADVNLPTTMPFILFPKQRDWIDYVIRKWRAREPGLTEKSRDGGFTWLAISLSCTLCLFNDGLAIGFGSRKSEYVDKIGTQKAILPKGRIFMDNLPQEFLGGYEGWRDAPLMRIQFPNSGSLIAGEGGDDIGRGDRTTIYFVDEAQPLTARVLTPHGWRYMVDMAPGVEVIGSNGRATPVTHINECGVHDVFRVTFSDGTSAECSQNHLWTVDKVWGRRERVTLRTHEIADNVSYRSPGGQTQFKYRIPVCDAVEFALAAPLPLAPYVVGALLGDGSVKSGVVRLTSADPEIVEQVRTSLPDGVVVGAFDGRYSYNIVDSLGRQGRGAGGGYIRSRARVAVAAAGIGGLGAEIKFIPDAYKFASASDRLALLQGLLDTDGSATGGSVSFHTCSLRLAQDVRFVVQSLGGTATHNVKPDSRGYREMHDIHIALPSGMQAFRLARKQARLRRRSHPPGRTIVAVERIGRAPVRCITVAAADGLYVTDNCIVTHNSAHLERPDLVDASLSQTTNCRIDISSVKGMNNSFARKRWGGKIEPFIFDWRDDPRKDDAWYAKQCDELDPVVVAQEIDRDYQASVTGVVVPAAWARACVGAKRALGIAPSGRKGAALDVADEGVDKNALALTQGTTVERVLEWTGQGGDIYNTTERAMEAAEEHGAETLEYDADGLGAGVRGDARVINEGRRTANRRTLNVVGFRGSASVFNPEGIVEGTIGREGDKGRTNEDYFLNAKAQAWWEVRRRARNTFRWVVGVKNAQGEFVKVPCPPDEILDISPDDPDAMKLVAELSQATYETNQLGKIKIVKAPPGMKSPNRADAVVIRYAPKEAPPMVVTDDILAQIVRAGRMGGRMPRR